MIDVNMKQEPADELRSIATDITRANQVNVSRDFAMPVFPNEVLQALSAQRGNRLNSAKALCRRDVENFVDLLTGEEGELFLAIEVPGCDYVLHIHLSGPVVATTNWSPALYPCHVSNGKAEFMIRENPKKSGDYTVIVTDKNIRYTIGRILNGFYHNKRVRHYL